MNPAQRAFRELNIDETRRINIKYSRHFKGFNANAKYNREMITFNLSSSWKEVDEDIQTGLIQSLLVKILKLKIKKTPEMQLYEDFMKGLSKYAKKHTYDPELEQSFERVNEKMFNGMINKPNLLFASESFNKLGSYEYSTDTIYMSTIFKDLPGDEQIFLDYVLYHELLHKKHQFNIKNGRHNAHTTAFKNDEAKFGVKEIELTTWLRKKRLGKNKVLKKIMDWW
jgi:predicted metal-dependent hydrolase